MEKVLIFGGLSQWGSKMTDALLLEGVSVTVTYTSGNQEEEERALAFGRNAQFEKVAMENGSSFEWIESGQDVDTLLFFDALYHEDSQETLDHLTKSLTALDQLKRIVLISHLDIYGEAEGEIDETSPLKPLTPLGKRVDALEKGFIQRFLEYKEETSVDTVIILRMPHLYDEGGTLERLDQDRLHVKDAAEGITQAVIKPLKSGIHVIQLSSGERLTSHNKERQFPYNKAAKLLNFKPKVTLELWR
ncbi:nucleoside-diphosphate-sugar epimerase [Pullulanibacillus pueri]|uniref:Uncharacterized protein n=1 Tax=Pullulanibacillus pueri TaxID=1437324 RepID=A0A8J2ZZR5_9BACL|nr:hypothetical protein [Pullulanibacillus pueri]MBM7680571.1 nucleoside-diphosphate-sugar epimerase [Pullulanibacillus pueri]GGH88710.1 hypothetical protein GCM10007096_41660 [Pullulanibacillus pueri]